jgi:DNA-binding PadR family transcriptional regulator
MRNRDFDDSPSERKRFTEKRDEEQFEIRQGRRGSRGPGPESGQGHASHERGPSVRGGRGRRGDVRLAILALLKERPMHGYEMMQELADRTQGLWRPSPGSLYPALQLLEDQGMVRSESADGRREFTLTEDGRTELASHPKKIAPWDALVRGADQGDVALRVAMKNAMTAVSQVAEAGSAEQKERAEELIVELRRQMYLLLAEAVERPTRSR